MRVNVCCTLDSIKSTYELSSMSTWEMQWWMIEKFGRLVSWSSFHPVSLVDPDTCTRGHRMPWPTSDTMADQTCSSPSLAILTGKRSHELFLGQQPKDKHDLIARVFRQKVVKLMSLLTKIKVFGASRCDMYTIEWQKRGLPHAHILLWLKDNIYASSIDSFIKCWAARSTNRSRTFRCGQDTDGPWSLWTYEQAVSLHARWKVLKGLSKAVCSWHTDRSWWLSTVQASETWWGMIWDNDH